MSAAHRRQPKSMFPTAWSEPRARLLESDVAAEYRSLVRLLDIGAEHLGRLQLHYERATPQAPSDAPLLEFIDEDLSDLFRCVAAGAANLLPGDFQVEKADPPEVEADVKLLLRYLEVAVLAAEHPSISDQLRNTFRETETSLGSWGEQTIDVVRAIADAHLTFALAPGG